MNSKEIKNNQKLQKLDNILEKLEAAPDPFENVKNSIENRHCGNLENSFENIANESDIRSYLDKIKDKDISKLKMLSGSRNEQNFSSNIKQENMFHEFNTNMVKKPKIKNVRKMASKFPSNENNNKKTRKLENQSIETSLGNEVSSSNQSLEPQSIETKNQNSFQSSIQADPCSSFEKPVLKSTFSPANQVRNVFMKNQKPLNSPLARFESTIADDIIDYDEETKMNENILSHAGENAPSTQEELNTISFTQNEHNTVPVSQCHENTINVTQFDQQHFPLTQLEESINPLAQVELVFNSRIDLILSRRLIYLRII